MSVRTPGKKAPKRAKAEPKRPGRPSAYSEALVEQICMLIVEGQSLRAICGRDDMPSRAAVFGWLTKHDDFARQYAIARELQADLLFDEILEIADDTSKDFIEQQVDGVAIRRPDHEHINRSRLRVDTRKWMAAKLAPKKYGDKVTQEVTGKGSGPWFMRFAGRNQGNNQQRTVRQVSRVYP